MLLRDFYDQTLPPTGHYALFQVSTKRHHWYESIEDLVSGTESLGNAPDIYYATGTFLEPTSRSQANADCKKAFFLDLDAGEKKLATQGPEKVYVDQQAAIAGIVQFSKETGLVPSLFVSSGEGLHLYWVLDEKVPAAKWTAIAKQFQAFGFSKGLKIDSSVTCDSARILRPVGTMHPNGKTVQVLKNTGKVYTLEEFTEAIGTDEFEVQVAVSKYNTDINDDVVPDVVGPPKTIRKVLQNCAAAKHAFVNQESIEEPYWRLMIGLAKHTVEGIDAAVACSSRHPQYNAEQTKDYFDRWATGPSTCEKFSEVNKTACAPCPHKGKIKSPIQLGELNTVEVEKLPEEKKPVVPEPKPTGAPWDGKIPRGFDVVQYKGHTTLVHYFETERENEAGDMVPLRITVPITHEVFWLGHWIDPQNSNDTAQVTVYAAQHDGRIEQFTMNQETVASRAELSKYLAGRGIHTTTDKKALASMEDYVKKQLQRIKLADRRPKIRERFGLTYLPDGQLIAVQGENAILPDGSITRCALSPMLNSMHNRYTMPIQPNPDGLWPASVWKTDIKPAAQKFTQFMRDHYSEAGLAEYRLAFMMGVASPLMAFVRGTYNAGWELDGGSFTLSLYSKNGGKGKTTIMQLISMAYGKPIVTDKNKSSSTAIARVGELSVCGTHPSFMDEMGSVEPKVMSDMVRQVANCSGRVRAQTDGSIKQSANWALMNIAASNVSIRDIVAAADNSTSDAVQYRMLELDVEHVTEHNIDQRNRFEKDFAGIIPTCGALGAILHLLICRAGRDAINEMVRQNIDAARRLVNSKQVDRIQERALGATITAHKLLDSVGLAPFDLNELCETFRIAAAAGDQFIADTAQTTDSLELLSNMLHDFMQDTIVTVNETRRTAAIQNFDVAINNGGRVPPHPKVRHITSSGVSYVSGLAMRDWCKDHTVRLNDLLFAAKRAGVAIRVNPSDVGSGKLDQKRWSSNYNLAKGMRENAGGQIQCYAFDVKRLAKLVDQDYGSVTLKMIEAPAVESEEAAVNE